MLYYVIRTVMEDKQEAFNKWLKQFPLALGNFK